MFPSLFGHPNSPLTQRCLGPVLQQLDGLLTAPRAPQDLLSPVLSAVVSASIPSPSL